MLRVCCFVLLGNIGWGMRAQDSLFVEDHQYREDQFYIAITYNLLQNLPSGVSQNDFSTGYHLGFVRDLPVNKSRTLALGVGVGLSSNSYNQNLKISENTEGYSYLIIDQSTITSTKNKFTQYLVELPIQFRWRNATPTRFKFWRIYGGFKWGYLLYSSSKFISNQGNERVSSIKDFNALQYGLTLSVGYSNWNVYAYYGLNPIFKENAVINASPIDINTVKFGLIFYIL